jgi:carboxyl-terminal processing protease
MNCFSPFHFKKVFLLYLSVLCIQFLHAQVIGKAAINAFTITSMTDKFHVQPKTLNDSLSKNFLKLFLKYLDEEHVYFNKEDIDRLSVYTFKLDDEILQKKSDFLKLAVALYTKRLQEADTIIDGIAKKPFNFSIPEKFTVTEDTAYPAGAIAMQGKLYKKIKLEVLYDMLDIIEERSSENKTMQKQMTDSIQTVLEKKTISVYKRNIQHIVQSPGGVEQFAANAYCKALAACYDPHTEFFPLTEKENFESELGNVQFRFGFSIKEDANSGVLINELEPGSPAYKCGLLNKGDKFQTLQWQGQNVIDVSNAGANELSAILSQSNHEKLTITVKKPDGSARTVTLMKEEEAADDDSKVKSFLLKGSKTFGYISLPAFYDNWENEDKGNNGCANDVAKEIVKLKKENISGLIIDLRYNGGGSVQEAVELAGIFIDAGPVAQIKSRLTDKPFTLKDVNRGTIYDGPLLILVNGYSASASELVAGTLQDYNRALIVGSPTYGKATGQVVLPLDSTINMKDDLSNKKADNYLKITINQLFRITGSSAQFTGITPDVVLPDLLEAEPQRESDEPFALLPATMDANKYYKPYPALPLATLQSAAKQDADTITYFNEIENYISQYKKLHAAADVSLNLKEVLADEKNNKLPSISSNMNYSGIYTVEKNAYDAGKTNADTAPGGINEVFVKYLSQDPCIKISYDLLTLMSK